MNAFDSIRDRSARAIGYVQDHRIAFGVMGGAASLALIVAFINRQRAASIGQKVVDKIKSVLGTPYIWGSRDPSVGLDCSGTVVWALRELGLEPKKWNATAAGMHKDASYVIFPQPGDLAFYGPFFGGVDHVMVYAGDGKVVGASGGGPSTKTAAEARAKNAEVKVLDVHYRPDFRGFGRLPVQQAAGTAVVGAARNSLIGLDVFSCGAGR